MKTVDIGLVSNAGAYRGGPSFRATLHVPPTFMKDGLVDFEQLRRALAGHFSINLRPIAKENTR